MSNTTLKWHEMPEDVRNFYIEHDDDISGYEKTFDWENKRIKLVIKFTNKTTPAYTAEYDFDGIKPEGLN